jgi:hypothetical protein
MEEPDSTVRAIDQRQAEQGHDITSERGQDPWSLSDRHAD